MAGTDLWIDQELSGSHLLLSANVLTLRQLRELIGDN
jgi:hypothetical protein